MTSVSRSRRPTVRDVASEAGVSVASVSRVLAGAAKPVSEPTRRKVLDAADLLGYSVNAVARSLATGRTGTVGLIVPDLGNQYFTTVAQSIVHAAREDGFEVLVGDSLNASDAEPDLARRAMYRTDGLIMCSPRSDTEELGDLTTDGTPMVMVNRRVPAAPALSTVYTDVLGATRALVEHLVAGGHTSIAFVGASIASEHAQARWRLIEELAVTAGLRAWQAPLETDGPDPDRTMRPLLAAGCTGILAFNDLQAAAVLRVLADIGVRVPDDVSVVGFDDTPLARWLQPRLTTASMHEREVGRAAWRAMHALLIDPGDVSHVEFTAEVVLRDSVAPAPAGVTGRAPAPTERGHPTTRS